MIKLLSDKIAYFLEGRNLIESEDNEVCSFGLEVLISSLINSILVLTLGIILNKFLQTLVFVGCYCYIRQYSGGYHASSHTKCILTFLCMYLATILIADSIHDIHLKVMIIAISTINWTSIYLLSPAEHANNPLSNDELIRNQKKARIRVTVFLLFTIIGSQVQQVYEYTVYSALALCWINFMLILQVIKNKGDTKYEKTVR